MTREVSVHIDARLSGRCQIIWSVAAAQGVPIDEETLQVSVDGHPVESTEIAGPHGTRLHRTIADGSTVTMDYRAVGIRPTAAAVDEPLDLITYLRPSRYAESDRLGPLAWRTFAGLSGPELLTTITDWVHDRLRYVSGSSRGTDGSVDTLLAGEGVCRDFSHLTIALLRAQNVPARLVSCYAPGLTPMEFHAVVEAWIDERWVVVDPTRKAPRGSLVRIATGRDAADTAFITNHWATLTLRKLRVTATAAELPNDDHRGLVALG